MIAYVNTMLDGKFISLRTFGKKFIELSFTLVDHAFAGTTQRGSSKNYGVRFNRHYFEPGSKIMNMKGDSHNKR